MPTAGEILVRAQQRGASQDAGVGAVLILDQDPTVQRLVSVWGSVARSPFPYTAPCPPALPEARHVRWMWAMLEPDPIPAWVEMSGLPDAPHVRRACFVAIDNCMVYPDGTVSRWASQYLRDLVAGVLLARRRMRQAPQQLQQAPPQQAPQGAQRTVATP